MCTYVVVYLKKWVCCVEILPSNANLHQMKVKVIGLKGFESGRGVIERKGARAIILWIKISEL